MPASWFQFHKGTIRTILFQVFSLAFQDFNSIKVQLEPGNLFVFLFILLHFNSIKVQLELSTVWCCNSSPIFQFHKGTIRTYRCVPVLDYAHVFQFHKGTIRTPGHNHKQLFVTNFNSIKVQLERWGRGVPWTVLWNFNSIKVQLDSLTKLSFTFLLYFNSIKVQLERTVETCLQLPDLFQFHKGTIRTSLPEVFKSQTTVISIP